MPCSVVSGVEDGGREDGGVGDVEWGWVPDRSFRYRNKFSFVIKFKVSCFSFKILYTMVTTRFFL